MGRGARRAGASRTARWRARLGLAVAAVGALLAAAAPPAAAADYWVRNGGSDSASGLSVASAWATLVHAADVVGPGDTVHVLDGSYRGFYLTTSGAPGAPITFRAEGPDVRITQDNPTTPDGINLEGASHVVIDGFVVDGRTRAGVRAVLGSHVTVRSCRLGWNGKWGILTGFVDDFTAEGNEAHHSQVEHGIYVSNSADRPVVRGNVVYSNRGNGLHFNGDASLGGDGLIEDAVVEGNLIWDNGRGGGSGINMDGSVRGVIRNNLLHDNHASGISLYRIDAGGGARDNLVANNTIVQASDGRWAINIANGSTGNTLRNNILYSFHSFRGVITIDASSRPGFTSDWNSVMSRFSVDGGGSVIGLAAWQGLGYDQHSFVAAPADHFVAPGSDFHLLATSPAVDAGTPSGAPPVDLDGVARPAGAGVDLGAYEHALDACGDGELDPGEACESDVDCDAGLVCRGCACASPAACESGIAARKPTLAVRAAPFQLRLGGEAVIPRPWSGIDPAANGVRVVVGDAGAEASVLDVVVPGGSGWRPNRARTRWVYLDRLGAVGGVKRIVVADQSSREEGRVLWRVTVRRPGGGVPDAASARAAVVLGAPAECAVATWNPPGAARPRCDGGATAVSCR